MEINDLPASGFAATIEWRPSQSIWEVRLRRTIRNETSAGYGIGLTLPEAFAEAEASVKVLFRYTPPPAEQSDGSVAASQKLTAADFMPRLSIRRQL